MFQSPSTDYTLTTAQQDITAPLRLFFDQHQEAIYDACALLAGGRGIQVVDKIVEGLASQNRPSRRTINAIQEVRAILTLEYVDDFDRTEAAYFMAIDPAEPVIEEICLLTDELETIMSDLEDTWAQQSNDGRAAA
jgi:hypothetical protein